MLAKNKHIFQILYLIHIKMRAFKYIRFKVFKFFLFEMSWMMDDDDEERGGG
jgi:hypothetical protein